jgi:biotin carboxyl carrier protein
MADSPMDVIRHALRSARKEGFALVEVDGEDFQFRGELFPGVAAAPEVEIAPPPPERVAVKSPAVGYFRPAADLAEGKTLAKGDVVGSLTALGISNDVVATVAGTIVEVRAEGELPVEFAQVLAWVQP